MADTSKQVIITPEDLGEKNVFVINDINLVVPPSQISIQTEGLTYNWRTLRSKSATKIPTGNGQINIHCSIIFTKAQTLALHRLLVQFRHSPFCYIDNRYIRESIVSEWPYHQNMAFTMTGISMAPLPGSSDSWVVELDFQWFNYLPYTFNWLYREDWQTNWLTTDNQDKESKYISYTIGWDLDKDTYQRKHKPWGIYPGRTLKIDDFEPHALHDQYSVTLGKYQSNTNKTIWDMQTAHAGVEFDLLPLPDNMRPARLVAQPKHSRIYVRYINLLQRDALMKNFGIDVETDLKKYYGVPVGTDEEAEISDDARAKALGPFFGVGNDDVGAQVSGLHTFDVPRALRKKWINRMLEFNHGVRFHFNIYKELQFPEQWQDKIEEIRSQVRGDFNSQVGRIRYDMAISTVGDPVDTEADWYFTVPVLGINPHTKKPWIQTSPFGPRLSPTYGTIKKHNGLDIDGDTGSPVMAPEDGVISRVEPEFDANGDPTGNGGNRVFMVAKDGYQWGFMHLDSFSENAVPGKEVKAGDVLGGVGTTGWFESSKGKKVINGKRYKSASTGSHLHLSLWKPGVRTGGKNGIDPTPRLKEIVRLRNDSLPGPSSYVDEFGPAPAGAEEVESENLGESEVPLFTDESVNQEEEAVTEAPEDKPDEELGPLLELLGVLDQEGWKYYDKDTSVLNVWYKTLSITVAHSGLNELTGGDRPERFVQEGVVLSNAAGALTHIVANLPLLSSEYPTHQHLGSIEPQYSFEFAVLDDQGNLEGISQIAQAIQGMRSMLQKNARQFRPVTDSWAVATDTFITRMFGSYEENDLLLAPDIEDVEDEQLLKRTIISSSSAGTIEGQPGLSTIRLNMEETNPYETEVLHSTAPQLQEKELARKKVLNALYNLDFIDKYKKSLLPLFIAQIQGTDTWNVHSDDYGKFSLNTYDNFGSGGVVDDGSFTLALLRGEETFIVNDLNGPGTGKFLLVRKDTAGPSSLINDLVGNGQVSEIRLRPFVPDSLENTSIAPLFQQIEVAAEYGSTAHAFVSSQVGASLNTIPALSGLPSSIDPETALQMLNKATADAEFYAMPYEDTGLDEMFVETPVKLGEEIERGTTKLIGRTEYYDAASFLDEHPDLINVPVQDIMDHYKALLVLMRTANRVMAEQSTGGLSTGEIRGELYDLPIKNRMWASWQAYMEEFVYSETNGIVADITPAHFGGISGTYRLQALYDNPNWTGPVTPVSWDSVPEDFEEREALKKIAYDYTGWAGAPTGALQSLGTKIWGLFKSTVLAGVFSGENFEVTSALRDVHDAAVERLVTRYMRSFPIQISFPDRLREEYRNSFGNLFGNYSDEKNKVPALESMHESFHHNAYSCGNITARWEDGNPYFQVERDDPNVFYRVPSSKIDEPGKGDLRRYKRGGLLGAVSRPLSEAGDLITAAAAQLGVDMKEPYEYVIFNILQKWKKLTGKDFEDYLFPLQEIGNPLGSAFEYPTDPANENVKLRYLKGLFAQIADDLLFKPDVLRVLGLEYLTINDGGNKIKGTECYPDLDLPTHPYYGDTFQVYPDFYMWNIYEDGKATNVENQERIYEQLDGIVQRCYQSMKTMREGHEYKDTDDKILLEPELDDPIILKTKMTPEGTDSQDDGAGPTSSPFAQTQTSKVARDKWESDLKKANKNDPALYSDKPADWLTGVRLSNTEGDYGAGAGIHYPARTSPQMYEQLRNNVQSVTQMFGDKAGYMNQHLDEKNTPEIKQQLEDTNLEVPIEYTHRFDENFLKKLARDSSKDLMSQKITLRRAFPTFKLFFIEEDEAESRYLNFDDFHSYNAVKSFTVVQSRKLPADHAVISVQNVAGTLDGTRRNTIIDLDYLDDTAEDKLDAGVMNGSAISGDRISSTTAQEQPFGAVVLRPGLNIQLRAGYSNDPDNLEVMLSGRVVDVTWNKTGDLAELMVQSFGTELIQVIKGTARDDSQKSYKTTHELLGSLMLEPEVVHFGRWEFGQLFQIGEASDYRLDFTEYSKEGFMGTFAVTDSLTRYFVSHPWVTFGLGAGAAIAQFFPIGRVARIFGGSKALSFLSKFGISAPLGKAGYVKAFSGGASRIAAQSGDDVLKFTGLAALRNVALKSAKTPGLEAQILKQVDDFAALAAKGFDSVDDAAVAAVKLERFLLGASFKGNWLARPELVSKGGFNVLKSVGFQPVKTIMGRTVSIPLKVIGGAGVAGGIADILIRPSLNLLHSATIGRVKKFFARTQAHMFLTPQDDNLFPPHPKDYMSLKVNEGGALNSVVNTVTYLVPKGLNLGAKAIGSDQEFTQQDALDNAVGNGIIKKGIDFADTIGPLKNTWQDYVEGAATVTSRAFTGSDEPVRFIGRLLDPDKFLSKKIDPRAAVYKPVHSTIWDMFHEMTLRHPGWIYGTRPYGTELRYTMFFGTPSQRYWSKGASNRFIDRMNRLYRHIHRNSDVGAKIVDLSDTSINRLRSSFINLYGTDVYNALEEDVDQGLEPMWAERRSIGIGLQSDIGASKLLADEIENLRNLRLHNGMMAKAMKEYLRGLEIRFVPFRRYHMITSEKDIIWNGLMNSENAVANAVDVTYWSDVMSRGGEPQGQIQTTVIKAHSSIPERLLRIAPIRYENCYTYEMAMRYGVGELLHRVRDMYRGEITLLGNPRIKPWDICILHDTYNDMVGPVEVEQVVHNFSHETGFITEIKPSAVVFANETSGWPMIQAMKMFALAIKDIEDGYTGVRAEDPDNPNNTGPGLLGDIASMINLWGSGGDFESFMEEKYRRIFGVDGASIEDVFGKEIPNTDSWNSAIKDMEFYTKGIMLGTGLTMTGVGSSAVIAGSIISAGSLVGFLTNTPVDAGASALGKMFSKMTPAHAGAGGIIGAVSLVAGGTIAATGVALMLAQTRVSFPSAMWLIGGPVLFAQCLRNEAIVIVPVMKNGHPIVSGFAYNDASLIWNDFAGRVNRYADDAIAGLTDMTSLYQKYGTSVWSRLNDPQLADMIGGGI